MLICEPNNEKMKQKINTIEYYSIFVDKGLTLTISDIKNRTKSNKKDVEQLSSSKELLHFG